MAKTKIQFTCSQCAASYTQWAGQCKNCQQWNTLSETAVVVKAKSTRFDGYSKGSQQITTLAQIEITKTARTSTGLNELDRVLGSGLVAGSVVLIGGDPGIGKSTLILQAMAHLSQSMSTLYVTGEESLQQVRMRAERLQINAPSMHLLAETNVESVIALAKNSKPTVMVIDSIQTMFTELLQSAPGGVAQVRESAAALVQFAKQQQVALFVIGHVTKEGALAGPRVLEHMVDAVLYFEGDPGSRFRVIRAMKNRFGAVNELGIFAMMDKGLREISNPSALFLSREFTEAPGSAIMVTWEGSRPLLVEVQALVDPSHSPNPRRVCVGLEHNRLALLLAVLHRHGGVATYDQDVFINVAGGVRVMETAADLALLCATLSSLRNKPLPDKLIIFGEVGLAGEIRPVQSGQERIREAAKHGFEHALVPKANAPKQAIAGMKVVAISHINEVIAFLRADHSMPAS